MSKMFYFMALVALVALLACGGGRRNRGAGRRRGAWAKGNTGGDGRVNTRAGTGRHACAGADKHARGDACAGTGCHCRSGTRADAHGGRARCDGAAGCRRALSKSGRCSWTTP